MDMAAWVLSCTRDPWTPRLEVACHSCGCMHLTQRPLNRSSKKKSMSSSPFPPWRLSSSPHLMAFLLRLAFVLSDFPPETIPLNASRLDF